MEACTIKGYPRLNWSVLDMAGATHRMFGSFGVAIEYKPIIASAFSSDSLSIEFTGEVEDRTKRNLFSAINRARDRGLSVNCKLEVKSHIRQHVGYGSSTQIILSSMDAIACINKWNLNPNSIIDISGRGRTTLIGCMTHYNGGFCIDCGQPYSDNAKYYSSHTPGTRSPALPIGVWPFPEEWKVSLLGETLPLSVDPIYEDEWIQSNVPMQISSAYYVLGELYHGVLPAIIEKNYSLFARSLNNIQQAGWNSKVMPMQTNKAINALKELWQAGYAAAISSLGPIISVIHISEKTSEIEMIAEKNSLSFSGAHNVISMYSKSDINSNAIT